MLNSYEKKVYGDYARQEGYQKGKTEGKAEGKAEGKTEVAKAMLAKGFSVADVSECTGLSAKEVAKLGCR